MSDQSKQNDGVNGVEHGLQSATKVRTAGRASNIIGMKSSCFDAVQTALKQGRPVPKAELAVLMSRYARVYRLGVSLSPWLATMLRVRE